MSTDYLFVQPSFLHGIGSLGNLGGTILSNSSKNENEADAKAISLDWSMVGQDIRGALDEYAA